MDYIKPSWGRSLYPTLLLLISITTSVTAQTKAQRDNITSTYQSEKLLELIQSFEVDYKNKQQKLRASKLVQQWAVVNKELDGTVVSLNDVGIDGTPLYYTTHMDPTSKISRADALYTNGLLDLGLSGWGMKVGVWDAGVARKTHQEFDSRVFNVDGGEVDNHGTLVTGTVISSGVKEQAKGVAFEAAALSHDWSRDKIEVAEAASNGLLLSNHSYGIKTDRVPDWYFGAYIKVSQDWDKIMFQAPYYLMVTAAGNAQNSFDNESPNFGKTQDGYDLLLGFTTSKNGLVIAGANANIDSNGNLNDADVSGYSSFGPTDDGRIKPDLSGDGTLIHSTSANSNTSYSSSMGTSMAAPGVTGSLLLLQEYYNQLYGTFMKAATLKGLALHTADDVKQAGPDYKMGWGVINTKKAAETLRNIDFSSVIKEEELTQNDTYSITVKANGNEPFSVSLSWTDPVGEYINRGNLNESSAALTNDLDVRVTNTQNTYLPWKLNPAQANAGATKGDNYVDPFERIDVNNASGEYTITISHKGELLHASQAFSLIITGAELTNCSLNAPEGLSIASANTEGVSIGWESQSEDTMYELQFKAESDTNWKTITTWGTTEEFDELQFGKMYQVRINSVCSQSLASEPSEILEFVFNGESTTESIYEPYSFDEELQIKVYPNPVVNELTVDAELSGDAQFSVITTSGTTIKSGKVGTGIDVADLATGLYVLTVQDYSGVKSTKFFKN